jgi:hypothetical protein
VRNVPVPMYWFQNGLLDGLCNSSSLFLTAEPGTNCRARDYARNDKIITRNSAPTSKKTSHRCCELLTETKSCGQNS